MLAALLGLVSSLAAASQYATPGSMLDKSKPFHQYTWLTAHNAFNDTGAPWANQGWTIRQQLERGVRGLMLDTYWHNGEVYLCHGFCSDAVPIVAGLVKLKDALSDIVDFLDKNRDAIVTLHLEDYVERNQMQQAFNDSPRIAQYVFNPARWASQRDWPSLQQMIDANQRLIFFTQQHALSGDYQNGMHMIWDQDMTSENYWSMGATIGSHDYSCRTRWNHIPLDLKTAANGWSRLFVMNHFHGIPESLHSRLDNRWDWIEERVDTYCVPAAGRQPNYLAVDHVHQGDVLEYVEWLNHGGLTAYEGNQATQDVVCGISTAIRRDIQMQASDDLRFGCENDEMRSLKLRGAKAGQRITFYDHPKGSRDDDFAILDIKQDIPFNKPVVIGSFEQNTDTPRYRLRYSGGNDLDGKVSYMRFEPQAVPLSEAAIVLLDGSGGQGRISCSFGLNQRGVWNLKDQSACYNDDARSARILAARAGTRISIHDSPSGATSDDYTVITVLRNFDTPIIVSDLESTYQNEQIKVQYFRKNGLNGKVSVVTVE